MEEEDIVKKVEKQMNFEILVGFCSPFLLVLLFLLFNTLCTFVFHIPNSALKTKEGIQNEMVYSYNKPRTEKQMLEEILYELKEINND